MGMKSNNGNRKLDSVLPLNTITERNLIYDYMGEKSQVIDTLLRKAVKDFSALLVSQGTQVIRISESH